MISKLAKAKDGDTLEFWGTGKPLRQHLYVSDLCKIISVLLGKHTSDLPIIVAPSENTSIKDVIELGIKISKKKVNYVFNGELDGQYRKDGSNKELLKLIGPFEFTPLEKALQISYLWYNDFILNNK